MLCVLKCNHLQRVYRGDFLTQSFTAKYEPPVQVKINILLVYTPGIGAVKKHSVGFVVL